MTVKLARPDLPAHHPQNVPLTEWTDGWLKMSVCEYTDALYLVAHDEEKRARGWPVTREEMIALLVANGNIPAAGTDSNFN
ncbi:MULTISPECIES: hypothetical protein [unclassified Xanthobacter]|uniref:hypothetical protein n=1 Tax=unclassified Xanthobacter TaxID=2623496 RepID=UPI001F44AFA4|nr:MULTISPECIES: hypothetical protein [unclassified Xanthobacter]